MKSLPFLPQLILLIATMLWGSSFIALKLAFEQYSPMWVIFIRMAAASICFLLMWKRLFHFRYQTGDWKLLLLMSAAEPCLYFIFEGLALQYTSASQAGMITAILPPMVALLAFIFLAERMTKLAIAGFGVAFMGLLWLSGAAQISEHASNPMLGNSLELGAMVCSAIYCLCLKKLSSRYSPISLTALQAFAGAIFFLPLALFQGIPTFTWDVPMQASLFLGVFVTLGAYLLYNTAIANMNLNQATVFSNLIPVYTLGFAYWLLDETLTLEQLFACGLILVGVIMSQMRKPAEAPAITAENQIGESV